MESRAARLDRSRAWWEQRRARGICAVCRLALNGDMATPVHPECSRLLKRHFTYAEIRAMSPGERREHSHDVAAKASVGCSASCAATALGRSRAAALHMEHPVLVNGVSTSPVLLRGYLDSLEACVAVNGCVCCRRELQTLVGDVADALRPGISAEWTDDAH